MQLYIAHFISPEEFINTDQSVQMYFTVFGFSQTLVFNVASQGKYFWKNNLSWGKNLFTSQEFFLSSVIFVVISGIKCYQFNEFDASLIILKYYAVRFF